MTSGHPFIYFLALVPSPCGCSSPCSSMFPGEAHLARSPVFPHAWCSFLASCPPGPETAQGNHLGTRCDRPALAPSMSEPSLLLRRALRLKNSSQPWQATPPCQASVRITLAGAFAELAFYDLFQAASSRGRQSFSEG